MICTHVNGVPTGPYFCIPMTAQGETLGVLYLEAEASAQDAETNTDIEIEGFSHLAAKVAERVSPAIANLKLRELLRNQSIRDPLTGLFNRRYLEESLEREIGLAMRKNHDVALVMFDLDHFKEFNDTFGHDAGDHVLRQVASVLRMHVRLSDIACRFGGEEFLVVLPETSQEAAIARTESIRQEIKSLSIKHKNQSLGAVTVSAGIAMFPMNGDSMEQVLNVADHALYRAKAEGRDRVVTELPLAP